jgi:Abnormal spindle-like microcephaly-assoc'd, ASPM-SPD-2-Hydin/Viral BACON domain
MSRFAPRIPIPAAAIAVAFLTGLGLAASATASPRVSTSPDSIVASLASGDTTSRILAISNTGDADLHFTLAADVPIVLANAAREPRRWNGFGMSPTPGRRSNETRLGHAVATRRAIMAGAHILLVEDAAPWGSAADEQVLSVAGLAYDRITSAELATTDLSAYRLMIVAADQPQAFYDTLRARSGQIENFVATGGVLEFHAAAWGSNGGDPSQIVLPGGLTIALEFADSNRVLLPTHPTVAGVPAEFMGTYASHAALGNLPLGATTIVESQFGNPTLVEYPFGAGFVIVSGQTLEFGYVNGQAAGVILTNLIPYAAARAESWLSLEPNTGTVTPGQTLDVAVRIDARRLLGGDHRAEIVLACDDPLATTTRIPVHAQVSGVPLLAVIGPTTVVSSTRNYAGFGASTIHSLPVDQRMLGGARIALVAEGEYLDPSRFATLIVEGQVLGSVSGTSGGCSAVGRDFTVDTPTFALWAADHVVDAIVQNTSNIGSACQFNRHTVTLSYDSSGDSIPFGDVIVTGGCHTRTIRIENHGSDVLHVSSVTTGDPAYTVSATAFDVAPGAAETLAVTLCPDRIAEIDAAMTVTSDGGTAIVALTGNSVAAPVAVVSPDSLTASLHTGQTADLLITVANTGGGSLDFTTVVERSGGPAPARAHPGRARTPMTRRVELPWGMLPAPHGLMHASRLARGTGPGPIARLARIQGSDPIVLTDSLGDGGPVDVVDVRASTFPDSVRMTIDFSAPVYPYDLGGAISLDVDQNPLTGTQAYYAAPGQDVGAEYIVSLFNLGTGSVDLFDAPTTSYLGSYPARVDSSSVTFTLPLVALGGDDGAMDFDGVVGTASYATDWFPNTGHGTIQSSQWLTVIPDHGSVPGGGSLPVLAHVDARGLDGGDLESRIHFLTNDPARESLSVAVTLHVAPAPDIVADRTSLAFDTLFVGATRVDSLEIRNRGVLPLMISAISTDLPAFTTGAAGTTLVPGQFMKVYVTFQPTSAGEADGHLIVTSDDPDTPSLAIALAGFGVEPPVLATAPDSLTADLLVGGQTDRTLTIRNEGAGDLHFSLASEDVTPVLLAATPRAALAAKTGWENLEGLQTVARKDSGDPHRRVPGREETAGPPMPASLATPHTGSASHAMSSTFSFRDGFEDGDFDGWIDAGGAAHAEVTSATAGAGSRYSLHLFGTTPGNQHFAGLAQDFGPITPSSIGFWVRPGAGDQATSYVVMRSSNSLETIWFYATPYGRLYVNADVGGNDQVPYTPLTWYHVEFRNIDFSTKTFDYFVNDSLVQTAIPFRNAPYVSDVERMDVYNVTPGSEAWWDEFAIGPAPAAWIRFSTTGGMVPPGSQVDVTTTLDATNLLGGEHLGRVVVTSDDPLHGVAHIPVRVHVTGVPQIAVLGPPLVVSGSRDYYVSGATTVDSLAVPPANGYGARITLTADGDYGDYGESASLIADGDSLGAVGATGSDCTAASKTFKLDAGTFAAMAADGWIVADVLNSPFVDVFCLTNRHTVTISIDRPGDHLDFGSRYQGVCLAETLRVANAGTDLLNVTGVSVDDPAYTVGTTSFTVPPGGSRNLPITLCLDRLGPIDATLSISSNAGPASSALTAMGLAPPVLSASLDSLSASLFTDEVADTILHIANTGADTLRYAVSVEFDAPSESTAYRSRGLASIRSAFSRASLPGVAVARAAAPRVFGNAKVGQPWGTRLAASPARRPAVIGSTVRLRPGPRVARLAGTITTLPIVATDPAGDAVGVDVTALRGEVSGDSLRIEIDFAGVINPLDFGGALSLDIDRNPATGTPPFYGNGLQDVGAEYAVTLFNVAYGFVDLYTTYGANTGSYSSDLQSNSLRFAIPLAALGSGLQTVDADLVVGNYYGPTDWLPDSGHVTITRSWLRVAPESGTLAAGIGLDHTVEMDAAGLDGGDYRARIVLDSNDPVHPKVRVPVGLHVTGVPRIAVHPDTLDFGTVYVSTSRLDSVMVVNRGTDALHVSGIVSSDPQYVPVPSSFVLAKHDSLAVRVAYTPATNLPAPAVLTITSDDPLHGVLEVALVGSGRLPPDVQVTPDSLSAAVTSGDSAQRTLTIANLGASDLHYQIEASTVVGLLRTPRAGVAPARTRALRPEESPPAPGAHPMAVHAASADSTPAGFVDGFEDGNTDGWFDAGYGNPATADSTTAANGTRYSLRLHTLYDGLHYDGVYHDLGGIQPGRVSFWVRPPDVTSYTNYVVFRDQYGNDAIFFFADAGLFYVNEDNGGDRSRSYNALTWYHIEFRNIDFAAQRFDYYVDGQLVKAGVYFRNSGAVGSFVRMDLYSYSMVDTWWDEIDVGGQVPGWLSVSPTQGVVAPGEHTDVSVVMRSAGFPAGDYRASLAVASDDPDTPHLTRPVHFHVIGAPRVAWTPDSLDFGRVFVGTSTYRSLLVMNPGDELLHVSGIVSSDPQCVPGTSGFDLAPGESLVVNVVYSPSGPDSLDATLSFATDDGHHPTVMIGMRGLGAHPPVMGVSPDSLVASLFSGDTQSQAIQIANTGLGSLDFHVGVRYTAPALPHRARPVRAGILRTIANPVRWGSTPGPGPSPYAMGTIRPTSSRARNARLADTGALAVVVADSVGDGGTVDVSTLLGAIRADSIVFEIDFATPLVPTDFAGVLSLDMDRDSTTGVPPPFGAPAQDVGAEYLVFMSTVQYGYVQVFTGSPSTGVGAYPVAVSSYSLRFALPRSAIHGGQNGVDVDLVVGSLAGLTDLVPDLGHGTMGARSWLSVAPDHGLVGPGQTTPLQASLDANGLPGGDYHAEVVVTGDDPLHGEVHVPVHLHVTGGPSLAVSADSLDFGQLFVGGTARETLIVANQGSADLHVGGVTLSDPHVTMTANPSVFTLTPGETTAVAIVLTGNAIGAFATDLAIASDDPNDPQFDVFLTGQVANPPDVHLPQLSVDAHVKLGGQDSAPFVIDNLGPSPLTWSTEVVYQSEGMVVASAPPVTATARVRVPKPQTPPDDSPPPADRIQSMGTAGRSAPARGAGVLPSRAGLASIHGTRAYLPPSLTLEEVRDSLDLRHDYAASAIPDRYDFTEGVNGNSIVDGGQDMFDFGNYLNTDFGSAIPYSDGVIVTNPAWGQNGRYFTRKYPGLFVLVADLDAVTRFRITGDLGADGLGSVDAATLSVTQGGIHYRGFVKRVYGSGTASVNHLIIVRDSPALVHAYATDTNNDYDEVENLSGIGRVYYLLFATNSGSRIDDVDMLSTMTRFLRLLPSRWLQMAPASGVVPPMGTTQASLLIDGREITAGDYPETLVVHTDDPDAPRLVVPVTVHADTVTAVTWSLVSADADRDAVRLVWYVTSGVGTRGSVERREGSGPWSIVGDVTAEGTGDLRFTDHDVVPGHTYGYRLHLTAPEETWTTEVDLAVPDQLVFALEGARPNPASIELKVAFTLPDGAAATLELLDLAGRRLRSEDVGGLGAGRHVMSFGGTRSLPGGVYLIRLTRGGHAFVSKVAIVR